MIYEFFFVKFFCCKCVENGTDGILKHFFHWNDSHLIIFACLRHDYLYIYFDSKSIYTIQFNTRTHNHAPFTGNKSILYDVLEK